MTSKNLIASAGQIESQILFVRGQRIMLDADLAALYEVETKRLNEQVRRNKERFPEDFMFQLTAEEFANLKSQFETSSLRSQIASARWGGQHRTVPQAGQRQLLPQRHALHPAAKRKRKTRSLDMSTNHLFLTHDTNNAGKKTNNLPMTGKRVTQTAVLCPRSNFHAHERAVF